MGQARTRVSLGVLEHAVGHGHAEASAVYQTVADGHTQFEVGRFREAMHGADLEGRHQQPKARNRNRKRVQVHACDGIQRLLGDVAPVARGLGALPLCHQAMEAAQQKVA